MVVLFTVSNLPFGAAARAVMAVAASRLTVRMVPVSKCLNFMV